jgi:hypothetical protein
MPRLDATRRHEGGLPGPESDPMPASAAFAALGGARQARSDPVAAERAVATALALEPDSLEVRLAAYKLYFYNHRLGEAVPHAEHILAHAARRLNISVDWRAVQPADAPFEMMEEAPGLYLQALLAWGYCKVRLGCLEEGCAAIGKVGDLDRRDRFGARRLLAVILAGRAEEEG